jgi:heptosyltransferase-1
MALSLGYDYEPAVENSALDYGLDLSAIALTEHLASWQAAAGDYLVFCQATTWPTKHLPADMWVALLKKAKQAGLKVLLPWVGEKEQNQVADMIRLAEWGEMLPPQPLDQWAKLIAGAKGIIGVDTGLTHLAAALERSTLALFGPTNPLLTGAKGRRATTYWLGLACSPCMQTRCPLTTGQVCFSKMPVDDIWSAFNAISK